MALERYRVEVVAALGGEPRRCVLEVPPGTSIRGVVERSGLLNDVAPARASTFGFGIWGEVKGLDTAVSPGDRIEIYAPLADDPKAIRRRRVAGEPKRRKPPG